MSTIPASAFVNITPNVLSTGGAGLDVIGLLLSTAARVPIGTVQSFGNANDVGDYFGPASVEAIQAAVYFNGFENSTTKPGSVLFAQYNEDDVAAFLRGGSLSSMTLAELQAINASLSIVIDGVTKAGSVNLAAATSFSNAALLIADALGIDGVQTATLTGAIALTTLTISAITGTVGVGSVILGAGVTSQTYITAQLTGTPGGIGTYTVSDSQTVGSEAMTADSPAVQFDSVSSAYVVYSGTDGDASTIAFGTGSAATSLKLTSATGAVLSQGADAAIPTVFMDTIAEASQNWSTFALLFNPDNSGHALRLEFAQWTNLQNDRYAFSCWDADTSPTTSAPATGSLGYAIDAASYSGTILVYAPDATLAVFQCAIGASIDFSEINGRTTFAYRKQSGLVASANNESEMDNLIANGYNFYGAVGTARNQYTYLYDGQVSGPFSWADSYINQIWLNTSFQEAFINLLQNAKSIPYNSAGNALIEASALDVITAGVRFGAIRAGVPLSSSQAAQVNAAAGTSISDTLFNQGWYLQILPATAAVRAARGTPPMKFWYMDGQSVQVIDMASVNIQ